MSEPKKQTAGEQEPNVPSTEPTQPPAVKVDIDAITKQAAEKASAAAEKKMEAVFKSMLEQQGLDTESINKMVTDWKSKQRTPEVELQEAQGLIAAEQAKYKELECKVVAMGKNIPSDKADKYIKLAEAYTNEKTDFAAALDLALVDFPLAQEALPQYAPGTGSKPLEGDQDEFAKRIAKYKK